jgi:hypothetical protein
MKRIEHYFGCRRKGAGPKQLLNNSLLQAIFLFTAQIIIHSSNNLRAEKAGTEEALCAL